MSMTFAPATKQQRHARIFMSGPAGSGKTWTALTWARELGERIAVVDTEHSSARAYASDFRFDHLDLTPPFTVDRYIAAINAAVDAGYDVLLIDSLSHAWAGKGGLLEQVDAYGKTHRGDSFGAWRDVTPQHSSLIEALLSAPLHIIGTARAKTDYQMQQNDRGKWEPVKLGLAPVQREGLDYEFDVVAELSVPDNTLTVTKTRCAALVGFQQVKPDASAAATLRTWLAEGEAPAQQDRPTVLSLYDRALNADTVEALRELYDEAKRFYLLPSVVEGDATLEQFIVARGNEIKSATTKGRIQHEQAVAQAQSIEPGQVQRGPAPPEDEALFQKDPAEIQVDGPAAIMRRQILAVSESDPNRKVRYRRLYVDVNAQKLTDVETSDNTGTVYTFGELLTRLIAEAPEPAKATA